MSQFKTLIPMLGIPMLGMFIRQIHSGNWCPVALLKLYFKNDKPSLRDILQNNYLYNSEVSRARNAKQGLGTILDQRRLKRHDNQM